MLIYKGTFEPLNRPLSLSRKPSVEETLKLELKSLPSHLKYVFHEDDDTLPMILSIQLSYVQIKEALAAMKRRNKSIG